MKRLTHHKLGAQILEASFVSGVKLFYVSPISKLNPYTPARGGIPILFPQFGAIGGLKKHGFVRDDFWKLIQENNNEEEHIVEYALNIHPQDYPDWPHTAFLNVRYVLTENSFSVQLSIKNEGLDLFSFTGGVHPYFEISSREEIQINGLESTPFLDSFSDLESYRLKGDALIERLYLDNPPISFYNGKQWLKVSASGFTNWMIWNPGNEGAKLLGDLPDDDWNKMICIEPIVYSSPVVLNPSEVFVGELFISID